MTQRLATESIKKTQIIACMLIYTRKHFTSFESLHLLASVLWRLTPDFITITESIINEHIP